MPAAPDLRQQLEDDPWSLTPAQRVALRDRLSDAQREWLPRLARLVEPPAPDGNFPAFLLTSKRFALLRQAIGSASDRRSLDTATADELQRFVDCYRDYLA